MTLSLVALLQELGFFGTPCQDILEWKGHARPNSLTDPGNGHSGHRSLMVFPCLKACKLAARLTIPCKQERSLHRLNCFEGQLQLTYLYISSFFSFQKED